MLDDAREQALLSGLVGKIWTLRRDYPRPGDADEFRNWSSDGTTAAVRRAERDRG